MLLQRPDILLLLKKTCCFPVPLLVDRYTERTHGSHRYARKQLVIWCVHCDDTVEGPAPYHAFR
jgi:hypothetical protein